MSTDAIQLCRATLAHHSKSFALASRLLPRAVGDEAAVMYTWCRRADDAIDLVPPQQQPAALVQLQRELDAVYAGAVQSDTALAAFQQVVLDRCVPEEYPRELLAGMEMDVRNVRYETDQDLLLYCFRVAGVVGLMMCHVMGVGNEHALRNAAHLGIGMQLTNICRDVLEDWQRDRLYLPDTLLAEVGLPDLRAALGGPLEPDRAREPLAEALRRTLAEADGYYRSGAQGLPHLSWRCALAVRTAGLVYARIGRRLEQQQYDVFAGRAVVSRNTKLALAGRALGAALFELPGRVWRAARFVDGSVLTPLRFPSDVLPV